ncbi:hypothetical protein HIM_10587 [Hirsutella minnesotensis 3608]|uniref:SP-RING-type domain-containing protein n=1 Tax=Hirsutella minnesotensis 3608 TaxID=1043627 RepID=A0A0F7ZFZ6_9HYPO|nr:hypothetical protein HIM_10587 [Hirsutella minnesotensis 3608]
MPRPAKVFRPQPPARSQHEHIASANATALAFLGARRPSWMTAGDAGSLVSQGQVRNGPPSHLARTPQDRFPSAQTAKIWKLDVKPGVEPGKKSSSVDVARVLPSPALSGQSSSDTPVATLAPHHIEEPQPPARRADTQAYPHPQFTRTPSAPAIVNTGSSNSIPVSEACRPRHHTQPQFSGPVKRAANQIALRLENAAVSGETSTAESLDRQPKRQRGPDPPQDSADPAVLSCAAPVPVGVRWQEALNQQLQHLGGFTSLGTSTERERYKLLYAACNKHDFFYLYLHQLFCLWYVKRDLAHKCFKLQPQFVDAAFELLSQILRTNADLPADHLRWLAAFPFGMPDLAKLVTPDCVRMANQQVLAFLREFAVGWRPLVERTKNRRYPVQAWELIHALKCASSTLQLIMFTCSRRVLGVGKGVVATDLERMFIVDCNFEVKLPLDPSQVVAVRRSMAKRYYLAIQQASNPYPSGVTPSSRALIGNAEMVSDPNNGSLRAGPLSENFGVPSPENIGCNAAGTLYQSPYAPHVQDQHNQRWTSRGILNLSPAYADEPRLVLREDGHVAASVDHTASPSMEIPSGPSSQFPASQGGRSPDGSINFHASSGPQYAVSAPHMAGSGWQVVTPSSPSTTDASGLQDFRVAASPTHGHVAGSHLGGQLTSQILHVSPPLADIYIQRQRVPSSSTAAGVTTTACPTTTAAVSTWPREASRAGFQLSRPVVHNQIHHRTTPHSQHKIVRLHENELPRNEMQSVRNSLHLPFLRSPKRVPKEPCSQRFYQFLRHFAVPPKICPPQKGLRELRFSISETDFSNIVKTHQSNETPTALYFDGCLRYRLRLCRQDRAVIGMKPTQWANCAGFWPQHIFLTCNDQPLQPRRRQHFQYDLPIELSDKVRSGENVIQISLPEVVANMDLRFSYFIGVEVVTTVNHQAAFKLVQEQEHISSSQVKSEIQRRLDSYRSDDLVIEDEHICVSVSDPFSSSLFRFPVRGVDCKHIECFDLDIWLQTRPQSQHHIGLALVDCWKCPICGLDARPTSLRIDDFFTEIQQLLVQRGETGTKRVKIRSDGTWIAVREPDEADEAAVPSHEAKPTPTQDLVFNPKPPVVIILDDD